MQFEEKTDVATRKKPEETHDETPKETIDALLQGRVRILQEKDGYRFSLDALLLTAFARHRLGERILDLGTGSGVIACLAATLKPQAQIVGVEIQPELARRAMRTVAMNDLSSRIQVIPGDVKDYESLLERASFTSCLMNPPYRRLTSGRINPHGEKALARHELVGSLTTFLPAARYALLPQGSLFVIYPASRLVTLVTNMRTVGIEPKRLRCVHSQAKGRAELVLVEGRKGGGEELLIEPPLILYDERGEYRAEARRCLTDLALVPTDDDERSPSP